MAVYVDLYCDQCGQRLIDQWSTLISKPHPGCKKKGVWQRLWTMTTAPSPGAHPSEKCVVYVSEKEGGKVQLAGCNDVPGPDRLCKRGYEHVETPVSQTASFERKHNVVNERRHFDRNGKGMEGGY